MWKTKTNLKQADRAKDKHNATSQNECLHKKHCVMWNSRNLFHKFFFKISLLLIAVAFIFIGILRGEHTLVLQKAVLICMECIGLG